MVRVAHKFLTKLPFSKPERKLIESAHALHLTWQLRFGENQTHLFRLHQYFCQLIKEVFKGKCSFMSFNTMKSNLLSTTSIAIAIEF